MVYKSIRNKGISFHYYENMKLRPDGEKHDHFEMVYIKKGKTTFITEEYNEEVSGETLFIIPEGVYHQFVCDEDARLKFIAVSIYRYTDERSTLLKGIKSPILISDKRSPFLKTFREFYKTLLTGADSAQVRTWLYYESMAMLCRMQRHNELLYPEYTVEEHSELVKAVIKYIDENMCSDITVDTIAEAMLVSPSTLSHTFSKEMGVSVYKYLTRKRLCYANELISKGERPTEIFYKCGFSDYSTFYRSYKFAFGTSPTGKTKTKPGEIPDWERKD